MLFIDKRKRKKLYYFEDNCLIDNESVTFRSGSDEPLVSPAFPFHFMASYE